MTIWKHVIASIYYDDERSTDLQQRDAGEIRIDEREIVFSYDDDGVVVYRGKNDGSGHFILEAPERNGRASLHRLTPASNFLEGYWKEDGSSGMWRIELGQAEMD